jgi:hypothetical protein
MSERSEDFMNKVWELRNNGADTEAKLVSAILMLTAETVKWYSAQNDIIVLDKNDILQLAEELNA